MKLPSVQFVSVVDLVVHEYVDPARVRRLERHIRAATVFTNPPIVTRVPGTKKYVVLDGANRTKVFRRLGFKHIIVQIVNYDNHEIVLKNWNHLVYGLTSRQVITAVNNNFGKNTVLFRLRGNMLVLPSVDHRAISRSVEILNIVANLYKGKLLFYRMDGERAMVPRSAKPYVFIVYPKFLPRDIILLTKQGLKVPSGITRHLINGRVLRMDVPLKLLRSAEPIANKNKVLRKLIIDRMAHNAIRFYQEPVYVFND